MPLNPADVAAEPASGPETLPSVTPEYAALSVPSFSSTELAAVVPDVSSSRQYDCGPESSTAAG